MSERLFEDLTRRAMIQRSALAGFTLAGAGGLLAACGEDPNATPASTSGGGDGGDGGGGGGGLATLSLAASATPQTLDGDNTSELESWEAQWNCYDQLVGYDFGPAADNVRPADISRVDALKPMLAERYEISEDGRTVTFTLRRGVRSAFGNELTTEDVTFSFDRMEATAAVRAFVMFIGQFGARDVRVIDDHTFTITSKTANPLLLPALALYLANIYDSTEVRKHITSDDRWASRWLQRNTAGFGPYNVTSLQSGQQAVFTAHEGYWGGAPAIKTVTYREVPEASNRLALLQQGAVSLAKDLTPEQLKQVDKQASYPGGVMTYVHINVGVRPFDQLDVRKALAYATPYGAILEAVYKNTAVQLRGPIIDTFPDFFGDEFFDYREDPEQAKSYLERAGMADGFDLELAYNAAQPSVSEIAIQLKGAWDAVGIRTTITRMDPTTFGARKQRKDLAIFLDTNLAQVPDVGYTALLWFQPESILNYGNYDNPEVTKLSRETLETLDPARRSEIARELQRILIDDLPFVYIAQPGYHVAIREPIESVTWVPNTAVTFTGIEA